MNLSNNNKFYLKVITTGDLYFLPLGLFKSPNDEILHVILEIPTDLNLNSVNTKITTKSRLEWDSLKEFFRQVVNEKEAFNIYAVVLEGKPFNIFIKEILQDFSPIWDRRRKRLEKIQLLKKKVFLIACSMFFLINYIR